MEQKKNPIYQDDSLRSYYERIRKTQLLSFEEEKELSRQIQEGNGEAKVRLIEANLRLVIKIARKFVTPGFTFFDLIQEGNLGLIKAASKYDHKKNVRFSTYASWWIKQSIVRAISNKRRAIRLPHRKEDSLRKIQKTVSRFQQQFMRKPTLEELSKEMKISTEDLMDILNFANTTISLDTEVTEETNLYDLYEDYSFSPDLRALRKSMQEETRKILERLKDRERKIILYRYALNGEKKHTLKDISNEMGISPETVRQIEIRALRKLKEQGKSLRDYLYN